MSRCLCVWQIWKRMTDNQFVIRYTVCILNYSRAAEYNTSYLTCKWSAAHQNKTASPEERCGIKVRYKILFKKETGRLQQVAS